ncbi:hydroxypyruvate isomerase [Providencia sp. Je.9.19]|uniref:hydroxypyruvate isomerase n=1 Tax=Providencia sp. Je.9.19 TaxID=3142844 RepID=UPI003DA848DC
MTKFAANLSMLFTEVDFMQRFKLAAKNGFSAVEYMFPYDFPAQAIKKELDDNTLTQVLFNLPAGDWDGGERGIACLPQRQEEFQQGVKQAIEYAKVLDCKQINCLVGRKDPALSEAETLITLVQNLRFAAELLSKENIRLLVEAVNTFDIPGFYLNRSFQVKELIKRVNHPNIYFQYDIYHMQRMEGELTETIKQLFNHISHIQLADNPGRHEPGTGEINYTYLFEQLEAMGYQGWIGCEYKPATTTEQGLDWLKQYS